MLLDSVLLLHRWPFLLVACHNVRDNVTKLSVVAVQVRYQRNFQVHLRTTEMIETNAAKIMPVVKQSSTQTTIEPDLE